VIRRTAKNLGFRKTKLLRQSKVENSNTNKIAERIMMAKDIRRILLASLISLIVFIPSVGKAAIIDLPETGGYGLFQDSDTGYIWLDLDNFYGLSFYEMELIVTNLGFTVATKSDVETLLSNDPLDGTFATWSYYANIMGSAPNRNLIWGAYEDGRDPLYSYVSASENQNQWQFAIHTCAFRSDVANEGSTTEEGEPLFITDMNIWAHSLTDIAVPIPATMYLFASGLLGLSGVAMRDKSA